MKRNTTLPIILNWLPLLILLAVSAAPTGRVCDALNFIERASAPADTTDGLGTLWGNSDGTLNYYDNQGNTNYVMRSKADDVVESEITLADNTTGDVSTSKHGFAPKAPNDTTKFLRGDATWAVPIGGIGGLGYTLHVQALTSSPADAATVYFGQLPKAPVTSAAISKVYIRKAGTIKHANIYCYSGTAGTSENWSLYIRLNNTTDTLIETIGASANERVFDNSSLSISVNAGDYIEIKGVQPTWTTNPATTIYGGYIYVE